MVLVLNWTPAVPLAVNWAGYDAVSQAELSPGELMSVGAGT